MAACLRESSANLGAAYATSRRVGEIFGAAERHAAAFLGCEADEIIFGPNMTTLDFALSMTAARDFQPGDEILVSALDHEGGVAPWRELAEDRGLVVRLVDVRAIDADLLLFSAYKICGPHVGVAYGRREVLEGWRPYKVKPAPNHPLGRRFETGCQTYELLAGFNATMEYLAEIGGMEAIVPYERSLGQHFLDHLPEGVTLYGLPTMEDRVPTFLIDIEAVPAGEAVQELADRGFGVWAHDTWYSLGLHPRLGYEGETIRVGFSHYNTRGEVDRFLAAISELARR